MTKITKLTPEQEARFPEFIEKWTRIGLSTEPANREKAEAINMAQHNSFNTYYDHMTNRMFNSYDEYHAYIRMQQQAQQYYQGHSALQQAMAPAQAQRTEPTEPTVTNKLLLLLED